MFNYKKGSSAIVAIVAIVIGLVIGYGMSKSVGIGLVTSDTKAADLRVTLNAIEREHVAMLSTAFRNGFDGRADFGASADSLDKNSVAFSSVIKSIYGEETSVKFLEIWRSHVGFFMNYTVAAKRGDKDGMDKAVTDLGSFSTSISELYLKANPNLSKEAVKSLVLESVGLLKSIIDSHSAGNFADSYANNAWPLKGRRIC